MSRISFGLPVARRLLIVGEPGPGRDLVRTVLGRLDYLVTCVARGDAALQAGLRGRFALALVALKLPDMPAFALVRRLRQREDRAPRPALVMFGDAADPEAMRRQCREAGADAFLQKPIAIGRLVATVRLLTSRDAVDRATGAPMGLCAVPLDFDHLRGFTGGDEQLERELISLFLATATLYVAELQLALEQGRDWSASAHALKGASAGIGALELARLAEQVEHAPPSAQALRALVASLDTLRDFVGQRHLAGADEPLRAVT
jgi:DNA-binding response OmpR family regulator